MTTNITKCSLVKCFVLALAIPFSITATYGATFDVTNPAQLQAALTTAESNGQDDTINVSAGLYNIATTLSYQTNDGDGGHDLTIVGAGADATILDGGNAIQILNINTDTSSDGGDANAQINVKGIELQNGYNSAGNGGGLFIFTYDSNINVEESDFSNNVTDHDGGVYIVSAAGTVTITGNRFIGNSSPLGDGGGAFIGSEIGTVTLRNNTLSSNTALSAGGARIMTFSGIATLTNNTVSGNTTTNGAGGGVYLWSNSASLTNNFFRSNSAAGAGGGAAIVASDITLSNNLYVSNTAAGLGGGLLFEVLGTATLINNAFGNNHSDFGGGAVGLAGNAAVLTNNTFFSNFAVNAGGGLVILVQSNNGSTDIYNNIVWGNTAASGDDLMVGADGDDDGIGSIVNLYNNDFSDFSIDVSDNLSQGDNIDQDPILTLDFHLQTGSPAIDSGRNSAPGLPSTDYEGDPRVMNAIVDIGVDEYPGAVAQVAVPTMSVWGLGILAAMLGLIGMTRSMRKPKEHQKNHGIS